jgi:hypothetical protein
VPNSDPPGRAVPCRETVEKARLPSLGLCRLYRQLVRLVDAKVRAGDRCREANACSSSLRPEVLYVIHTGELKNEAASKTGPIQFGQYFVPVDIAALQTEQAELLVKISTEHPYCSPLVDFKYSAISFLPSFRAFS